MKFCYQVQTAWLNKNILETLEKENEIFIEVRYQLLTGVITFQAVIYGLSEEGIEKWAMHTIHKR